MSGSLTTVGGAVWRTPGSYVQIGYSVEASDFVAVFFDGDHEAPALVATGITAAQATAHLAEMIREELV